MCVLSQQDGGPERWRRGWANSFSHQFCEFAALSPGGAHPPGGQTLGFGARLGVTNKSAFCPTSKLSAMTLLPGEHFCIVKSFRTRIYKALPGPSPTNISAVTSTEAPSHSPFSSSLASFKYVFFKKHTKFPRVIWPTHAELPLAVKFLPGFLWFSYSSKTSHSLRSSPDMTDYTSHG